MGRLIVEWLQGGRTGRRGGELRGLVLRGASRRRRRRRRVERRLV